MLVDTAFMSGVRLYYGVDPRFLIVNNQASRKDHKAYVLYWLISDNDVKINCNGPGVRFTYMHFASLIIMRCTQNVVIMKGA